MDITSNQLSQPALSFPKILVVEGLDGAGKTTLCSRIIRQTTEYAKGLSYFSQPGGTLLAEDIRKLIKNPTTPPICSLYLLHAARLSVMKSDLFAKSEKILLDRWVDSTYAYQGAQGVPDEYIMDLEKTIPDYARADKTVFVDVLPDLAVKRNKTRNRNSQTLDAFDSADEKFFERCRQRYMDRIQANPSAYLVVDGSLKEEEIADFVIEKLGLK